MKRPRLIINTQENDYIEDLATDCTNLHRFKQPKVVSSVLILGKNL